MNETVTQECTRRWYSVGPACECQPCTRMRVGVMKLRRHGYYRRVPSEQAWTVIEAMEARQWSTVAMSSAAGLNEKYISELLSEQRRTGHRRRIGATIAHRIITHGEPTTGSVGAIGSRRKLQALARIGHGLTAAAEASRRHPQTLASVRRGDTERIATTLAADIDKAWRELWATPAQPGKHCAAAIKHAVAQGWISPLGWDDIDDPAAEPRGVDTCTRGYRLTPSILELDSEGYDVEAIARRLECSTRTVERALSAARKAAA